MPGLTSEQKQQYDELGYVLLKGLFDPADIQPLIDELESEVDRIARAYHADGLTDSLYAEEGFETRFMRMVEDSEQAYEKMVGSKFLGPEVFRLLSHPTFLDIVEGIVGPEVHCQGRHRLRPKIPNFGVADFRWHEDTDFAAKRVTYVQQQYGLDRTASKAGGRFMSRIVAAPDAGAELLGTVRPGRRGERLPARAARRAPAHTAVRGAVGTQRIRS